jgi:hypothetical protein
MSRCEICGEDFKNLGVHMYQKHRELSDIKPGKIIPLDGPLDYTTNLVIDVPKEKPLSEIIEEIKRLLRSYRFTVRVSYEEEDVNLTSVEILARFQVRR